MLATIHRAENTDNPAPLRGNPYGVGIIGNQWGGCFGSLPVLLPLHPRTRARIDSCQLQHLLKPLTLLPPLSFLEMVLLERRACLVVTDSGGVQKEAFLQGTPCVTVRTETEWVEMLDCGWNQLANPADSAEMLSVIQKQLALDTSQPRPLLYGDGHGKGDCCETPRSLTPSTQPAIERKPPQQALMFLPLGAAFPWRASSNCPNH